MATKQTNKQQQANVAIQTRIVIYTYIYITKHKHLDMLRVDGLKKRLKQLNDFFFCTFRYLDTVVPTKFVMFWR